MELRGRQPRDCSRVWLGPAKLEVERTTTCAAFRRKRAGAPSDPRGCLTQIAACLEPRPTTTRFCKMARRARLRVRTVDPNGHQRLSLEVPHQNLIARYGAVHSAAASRPPAGEPGRGPPSARSGPERDRAGLRNWRGRRWIGRREQEREFVPRPCSRSTARRPAAHRSPPAQGEICRGRRGREGRLVAAPTGGRNACPRPPPREWRRVVNPHRPDGGARRRVLDAKQEAAG